MFTLKQVQQVLALAARLELNQAELARRLGVTSQTVNNWKRRGHIPPKNLAGLSVILGTPIEELIEGPSASSYETSELIKAFHRLSKDSRVAALANVQALLKAESHRAETHEGTTKYTR